MLWVIVWIVLGLGAIALLGWLALRIWRRLTGLTTELATVADGLAGALESLDDIRLPEASEQADDDDVDGDLADRRFTAARRVNPQQPT